jgi:hypothetical protein
MLVILPHGLLAMTIVSKLHVRNGVYDLNNFWRRKCMEISS